MIERASEREREREEERERGREGERVGETKVEGRGSPEIGEQKTSVHRQKSRVEGVQKSAIKTTLRIDVDTVFFFRECVCVCVFDTY